MSNTRARLLWRAWRARLRDERGELAAARASIPPGALACDIGAHKGSYLYWLSRWAGRVVAFEPQPDLAGDLAALALPNVTVEAKGVYSRSGPLDLYIPDGASAGASVLPVAAAHRQVTIPVVALDDYFAESPLPSFLKIDVEGAELEVFRGAERILAEQGPALLFECEGRHLEHGDVFRVFAYLERRGYAGEFFCRGERLPLSRFDPATHQRRVGSRFWDAPDYCNNFLFRKVAAGRH